MDENVSNMLNSSNPDPGTQSIRESAHSNCCLRPVSGGGIRILWEITQRCPLDCCHCFVGDGVRCQGLSTVNCFTILDNLGKHGVSKVLFAGGEPTVRGDLFKLARYAREHEILVDINSNGFLINREVVRCAGEAGVGEFTISLDGAKADTNDRQRRKKGAFDRAIQAIKMLQEEGIKVDISFCVTGINKGEIAHMCDLCEALGVASITFIGYMNVSWSSSLKELFLNWEDRVRLKEKIDKLASQRRLPIRTARLVPMVPTSKCPACDSVGFVDVHGRLQPCGILRVPVSETSMLQDTPLNEARKRLSWVRQWIEQRSTAKNCLQPDRVCRGCPGEAACQGFDVPPSCDGLCVSSFWRGSNECC